MTRQDAYVIARKRVNDGDSLIDALEALGLIKFEVEKTLTPTRIIDQYNCPGARVMKEIEDAGYRIVKIGVNSTVTIENCTETPSINSGRHFNGKLVSINPIT